jgi:glycyl-tRNA synthetase beta chain
MGGYYALHDGEPPEVAAAIRDHYAPKGPSDAVPTAPVSIAVALADKIDLLAQFFAIDEKPTGSGDPYALRRAALGIIRIIRENGLRLPLRPEIRSALSDTNADEDRKTAVRDDILAFIVERLRVQLRTEGRRHDVLAAAFAAANDDDLTRLLRRADAVEALLGTAEGADLLAAYRRATNILRIEERKGPLDLGPVDASLLEAPAERALDTVLNDADIAVTKALADEDYATAMTILASIRPAVDAFFESVTVNSEVSALRINRLRLLKRLGSLTDRAADFSRLETTGTA